MSEYIELISEIRPINNLSFALADVNDLRGGYIQVETIQEMKEFLLTNKTKEGMLCYVKQAEKENNIFQLKDNVWVQFLFNQKVDILKKLDTTIMTDNNILSSTRAMLEIQKATDLGSVNLLRNSGFTGQYVDKPLIATSTLNSNSILFNDKLEGWTGSASVNESIESISGYTVTLGSLSQSINLIVDEVYLISYKAFGTKINVSCGSYSKSQVLTNIPTRYVHKFKFIGNQSFLLSGVATVYDLKLERGTIVSDWTASPLDNDKSLEKLEAISYIQKAIKRGNINLLEGLTLMNILQLGNYKDGKIEQVTAGISGVCNDEDDVAFWSGGTLEQAIRTISFYTNNPKATPTKEELKLMANYVVTHGGKIILNNAIIDGFFRGSIETSVSGIKVVIDQKTHSISMFNSEDIKVGTIEFKEEYLIVDSGAKVAVPNVWLSKQTKDLDGNSIIYEESLYTPSNIFIKSMVDINSKNYMNLSLNPKTGLKFWEDGKTTVKEYPAV